MLTYLGAKLRGCLNKRQMRPSPPAFTCNLPVVGKLPADLHELQQRVVGQLVARQLLAVLANAAHDLLLDRLLPLEERRALRPRDMRGK